jgi:hypothetical protein
VILYIRDVESEVSLEYRKIVRQVLEHMRDLVAAGKSPVDTYANYVPWLRWDDRVSNNLGSAALYELHEYCQDRDLPWLNFLVVTANDGLPSTGMENWYEETFQTLKGYTDYAKKVADLCTYMLENQIILIQ